ncbi:MAG: sigma-70 family RNA polymerase sigma factor, partial [Chitinophagaceae bacterium]|nr:sigma-70 family RNA polymerase sigma factor [Chitinophagaceae bacterium]
MLFKKYIGILKPFVFSFTKSDAIADELIQDSFIRVWLSRDKLPEIDSFKPWLFKIAANECYRYLRKELTENNAKARIHAKLVTEVNNQVNDHISIEEIKRIAGRTIDQLAPQRKKIYQM